MGRSRKELEAALAQLKAEQKKVEAELEKLDMAEPYSLDSLLSRHRISCALYQKLCVSGIHDIQELKDLSYPEIYKLTRNASHTRKIWSLLNEQ